jgi:hypothetical protein
LTPLGDSSVALEFENGVGVAGVKVAPQVEMVMNGSMNGRGFLQTSHTPKAQQRTFSSSKRLMRVLTPIVQPTAGFLLLCIAYFSHCSAVGSQFVDHDDMRVFIASHRFFKEFQCRLAIPSLGDIAFQHFSFVANSSPEVVDFTVDLYRHLVQMPLPIRMSNKSLNPFSSDLRGKLTKPPCSPQGRFL